MNSATRTLVALAFSAACIAAATARAQLASDNVPRERTVSRSDEIVEQLTDSRYRLGAIRIRPTFALRDTGYDNNVFGSSDARVSDWRSTASAGADLILPFGRKVYVLGVADPEYTWYKKLTNRRAFGGTYGGSLLGLFNHLSVEAGGTTAKTVRAVSSEIDEPVPGRLTDTFARTEFDIFQRLSLFGSAERQQHRFDLPSADSFSDLDLQQLARDDTFFRGGVRYKIRSYADVSLAAETGRSEFVSAPQTDNDTRAVLLGFHYDRPRFFVNLSGGARRWEPRGVLSTFPSFSSGTGSYYASYELVAPIVVDVYGNRSAVYSISVGNPFFYELRNGLGMTLS
ncbi:MAG: hypothetical protein ACXV5L_05745, partial [Thermoanaerobaculia bacterium]